MSRLLYFKAQTLCSAISCFLAQVISVQLAADRKVLKPFTLPICREIHKSSLCCCVVFTLGFFYLGYVDFFRFLDLVDAIRARSSSVYMFQSSPAPHRKTQKPRFFKADLDNSFHR